MGGHFGDFGGLVPVTRVGAVRSGSVGLRLLGFGGRVVATPGVSGSRPGFGEDALQAVPVGTLGFALQGGVAYTDPFGASMLAGMRTASHARSVVS
jgi:hypothetical protein